MDSRPFPLDITVVFWNHGGVLSWSIFRNYLLSRRSGALVRIIAWHCIFGIGVGVAALVIVLSVMNGFNITIRAKMLSVDPHLIISEQAAPSAERTAELHAMTKNISRSGVQDVSRFETQDVIVRASDVFSGAVAKGYDTEALHEMLTRIWRAARRDTPPPDRETAQLGANEIVIGADLARTLGVFEGDDILLIPPETLMMPKGEIPKFNKFKIKAMFTSQTPDFDSKMIFYNLDNQPRQRRVLSRESGVEIRLNDPYEADAIKKQLVQKQLKVQTWNERDTALFFALKVESTLMALFLLLAVLITSFSIVTVMLLLMNQKRQDIGMLMAIGLSVRRSRAVFLQVGLFLCFIGITSGVFLGSIICLILDWYPMELLPDIYTDSTLPAKLTLRILFFVLGSSSLIAIIGSWLPVWRYIVTNPSEALRKPGGASF